MFPRQVGPDNAGTCSVTNVAPGVLPEGALSGPATTAPRRSHVCPAEWRSATCLSSTRAIALPAHLAYALRLFRLGPRRAFLRAGHPEDALHLFVEMLHADDVSSYQHTVACILKSCSRMCSLVVGRGAQVCAINRASCGDVVAAQVLFDALEEKGVVTWNAMVAGYLKNGDRRKVVEMFKGMFEVGAPFDEVTLVSVATACGRMGDAKLGEWIGEYVEKNGMTGNQNLATALVDMHGQCFEAFKPMPVRNSRTWTALVKGKRQRSTGALLSHVDHPQLKEIYEKVEEMIESIKMAGYVPNTDDAKLDVDENEKEVSVSHHSEKLAIVFGLMKLRPGATIRLSKNLRVRMDCLPQS
ncbi:hypothetical protein ABZP36_002766 [Zizania latifolia]